MNNTAFVMLSAVLGGFLCTAHSGKSITVGDMPPSVVKTIPMAGDTQVDPSLKEVRVTFSKDMMTKQMWSWAMTSKETFPTIDADKIHYLNDQRTCVLPVKLKPNHSYEIWINSEKYNSFRDKGNRPAKPYLLVFETGSGTSSSEADAKKAAVSVTKAWLKLIDNGRYRKSWKEAASIFKAAVTVKQWPQMIQATRGPLGKKVSRKLKSKSFATSLPGAPDGQYVVIQLKTAFENKKDAVETITVMLDNDSEWRVAGYFIK